MRVSRPFLFSFGPSRAGTAAGRPATGKPAWRLASFLLVLGCIALAPPGRGQTGAAPLPGTVEPAFNPGLGLGQTASISAAVRQPDGRILLTGSFTSIDGTLRQGLVRLDANGRLDRDFRAAEAAAAAEKIALQPDGRILISSPGAPSGLLRLNADGSIDPTFRVEAGIPASAGLSFATFLLQPDGKILAGRTGAGGVVRLLPDGARDFTFVALTGFDGGVTALALQPDGKILVGGSFSTVDGQASPHLVRLLADGRLDTAFPGVAAPDDPLLLQSDIRSLEVQPNGKIVVVGTFTPAGSRTVRQGLSRLNADGTLDGNFRPAAGLASGTGKAVLLSDSQLLVSVPTEANFLFPPPLGSGPQSRAVVAVAASETPELTRSVVATSVLYRLRSDGQLDGSFLPTTVFGPPAGNDVVTTLTVQPGGRILVGGRFNAINNDVRSSLAQLDGSGATVAAFNPAPQLPGAANALLPLPDGQLVVGGSFATAGGSLHASLARLRRDGSVDETFTPETDGEVRALARHPDDGAIVLAGEFRHVNGVTRPALARIRANGGLDSAFAPGGALDFSPVVVAIQPDGKIVVGGYRTVLSGDLPAPLVRLNRDGSLDPAFRPAISGDTPIAGAAVLADGRILVSGSFRDAGSNSFSGQIVRLLARWQPRPGVSERGGRRRVSGREFPGATRRENPGEPQSVSPAGSRRADAPAAAARWSARRGVSPAVGDAGASARRCRAGRR